MKRRYVVTEADRHVLSFSHKLAVGYKRGLKQVFWGANL